jgi:hypothetical protein
MKRFIYSFGFSYFLKSLKPSLPFLIRVNVGIVVEAEHIKPFLSKASQREYRAGTTTGVKKNSHRPIIPLFMWFTDYQ